MVLVRNASYEMARHLGSMTWFGNPCSTEETLLQDFPDGSRYILALQEGCAMSVTDGYAQTMGKPVLVNLQPGGWEDGLRLAEKPGMEVWDSLSGGFPGFPEDPPALARHSAERHFWYCRTHGGAEGRRSDGSLDRVRRPSFRSAASTVPVSPAKTSMLRVGEYVSLQAARRFSGRSGTASRADAALFEPAPTPTTLPEISWGADTNDPGRRHTNS